MKHYFKLSEYPNLKVPSEQIARIEERYSFGAKKCEGVNILEIGCGTGMGAKVLSLYSKYYVGCDIDSKSIEIAKKNNPSLEFVNCDAKNINKRITKKFDAIIIFESIYYFKDIKSIFLNLKKILKEKGIIIICLPNKNLKSFTPGAYTYEYDDQISLKKKFKETGFILTESYASFSIKKVCFWQKITQPLKLIATKLNLIPKTMKSKEFLKKFYYGFNSKILPNHIKFNKEYKKNMISTSDLSIDTEHKILYFIGKKL